MPQSAAFFVAHFGESDAAVSFRDAIVVVEQVFGNFGGDARAIGFDQRQVFFGRGFFGFDRGALRCERISSTSFSALVGGLDAAIVFFARHHLLEQAIFGFRDFLFGHLHFVLKSFVGFVGFDLRGLVAVFADAFLVAARRRARISCGLLRWRAARLCSARARLSRQRCAHRDQRFSWEKRRVGREHRCSRTSTLWSSRRFWRIFSTDGHSSISRSGCSQRRQNAGAVALREARCEECDRAAPGVRLRFRVSGCRAAERIASVAKMRIARGASGGWKVGIAQHVAGVRIVEMFDAMCEIVPL